MCEELISIVLRPPGQDPLVASYDHAAPVRIITIKTQSKDTSDGPVAMRIVGILNGHPDEKRKLVQTLGGLEHSICTLNGLNGSRQGRVDMVESDERSFVIRVLCDPSEGGGVA